VTQIVAPTVNASLREPVTDEELAEIILTGRVPPHRLAHVFALYTDVPLAWLLAFAEAYGISLETLWRFYQTHVQPFYRNERFEGLFRYA